MYLHVLLTPSRAPYDLEWSRKSWGQTLASTNMMAWNTDAMKSFLGVVTVHTSYLMWESFNLSCVGHHAKKMSLIGSITPIHFWKEQLAAKYDENSNLDSLVYSAWQKVSSTGSDSHKSLSPSWSDRPWGHWGHGDWRQPTGCCWRVALLCMCLARHLTNRVKITTESAYRLAEQ